METFRFHHVGIAVANLQDAIQSYKNLLGYELVSGPFDDPIQKVSVCFLSRGTGDPLIEPVAPLGSDSPIREFLRKGSGIYHICYEVTAMDAAIQHLTDGGCMLLSGPVPAVAFGMRKIAWLMTDTYLLMELVEA